MTPYPQVTDERLFYLKDFQSKRLRNTYQDFIAIPKYEATCFFFFNRLYGTEDVSERDEAFKNIYHIAKRFLGGSVVRSMKELIELQELTIALDDQILVELENMKAPTRFDTETYEKAYRASNNYPMRVRQIELLESTMRLVHKISHRFGIGMVLKGLHQACLIFGDTRMVDFLIDGYRAFADIPNIDELAEAMVFRERQRLERIYGNPIEEHW